MGATKLKGEQLIDNTRVAVVSMKSIEAAAIAAGEKTITRTVIPYSGTIVGWYMISDVVTTMVLDVWMKNAGVPDNSDSITAAAKPTLTASQYASSNTLTGWTTDVTEGDVIVMEVESNNSAKEIGLYLKILKD